jgi:hypothetical protein
MNRNCGILQVEISKSHKGEEPMIRKTVCLVFVASLLAMTACTSASGTPLQSSENHLAVTASDYSKTIFFPRQEETNGERAVMEGEINGTLVLVDNCIRVDSDYSNTSYLLIWPPYFNMTTEDGTINILNGNGVIVSHIGDKVHIGGGEIKLLSMLDKPIQEQVPPQCAAPYWVIGDEIITKNISK